MYRLLDHFHVASTILDFTFCGLSVKKVSVRRIYIDMQIVACWNPHSAQFVADVFTVLVIYVVCQCTFVWLAFCARAQCFGSVSVRELYLWLVKLI